MTRPSHRLDANVRHGFGGGGLDRAKPIRFRLDGIGYDAFEGDTILSALLAAGVDTAGLYHGEPIGLDERFTPLIAPKGNAEPVGAMPMDRVPATAAASYVSLGPGRSRMPGAGMARRVAGIVGRRNRSLGHRLDEHRGFEGTWAQLPTGRTIETETAVVGGGLAGMSAALAAADAGGRVVLVERRTWLGGDARFFGTVGDEEAPEAIIARLTARIAATPSITVLTSADAFALAGTRLRVHQVELRDGMPGARVVSVVAERVVVATGAAERLPVFPGNRAPRVVGAVAAYHRAERYGVWQGQMALFATPHNFGYRLALLAADAGIEVQRVVDSRIGPQSRFIDFCKASGITLASGLVVRSAEPAKASPLAVGFSMAHEGASDSAAIATDQLIVAGGWQPRLALWVMAGGGCSYDATHQALAARGLLDRVGLAGAVAGLRSSTASLGSGEAAVNRLLGRKEIAVEENAIDAVYESRDDATGIAPWRAVHRGAAFLDGGLSFATRPPQLKDAPALQPQQMQSLSIGDVAAAVAIGLVAPAQAGIVAEERCLGGAEIADGGWRLPPEPPAAALAVPPWLHGRFGAKPQLAVVAAADQRQFEAGCLVYSSSDAAGPAAAVGAVIGPATGGRGTLVLVARTAMADGTTLFVRDSSGHVPVSLVEKVKAAPVAATGEPSA